jgi:hypothetical protein
MTPSSAQRTPFRRAFFDHGHLCVETRPGECWYLPNPLPDGQRYDPALMLPRVVAEGAVNLARWRRMNDGHGD